VRFITTENLLKNSGEYFDPTWIKNEKFNFPEKINWDYSRELQIEDIDLWEIIYDQSSVILVLAAYQPYAEFYIIKTKNSIETFYGKNSQKEMSKRAKILGIPLSYYKVWVEPEDMWLYTN
jgi:hypothetical protein